MMINCIVILSLATRAISSVSVQGSLSTFDDDTVSINLHANKSNNVDELVRKLHSTRRISLTVDLGGTIVNIQQMMLNINDGIDHYQDYLVMNFNKITSVNIMESKMASRAINDAPLKKSDSTNSKVGGTTLREVFCKTLYNDDFMGSIISRTCNINLISIDEENQNNADRGHNKTRSRHDTKIGNEIASKIGTRIFSHSTLATDTDSSNFKRKNSITAKINPIGREIKMNESTATKNNFTNESSLFQIPQDKYSFAVKSNSLGRKTSLNQKIMNKNTSNNLYVTKLSDSENRFQLSENVSVLLSDKSIIKSSSAADKHKVGRANTMSHAALQENVTNIPRIFSRRTFQTIVPSSKDQNTQNQPHVSRKNMQNIIAVGQHDDVVAAETRTKADRSSAMDEILEAVRQVLPTEEHVKMPSKGSKVISAVS